MHRGWATTARAPPSLATAVISSPPLSSRRCSRAQWRASVRRFCSSCPTAKYSSWAPAPDGWRPIRSGRWIHSGVLPRRYLILEVSADLAARQQALLHTLPAHLAERVVWLDRLPAAINGIVLANEVADALPFERFVVRPEGFDLRGVGLAPAVIGGSDTLQSIDRPAPAALAAELARISAALPMHLPSGYVSEICPLLGPWIGSLAASLARGVVLLFDYGLGRAEYYHPQRDTGTMRCHFRHRAHDDPLLYPGLQDITAWVDFTRVAEAAVDHGLEVAGFCTQAAFLLANGIEADVAAAASDVERARLAAAARQLLLPGEMGEHFKLMALTRDCFAGLDVFALQDLRRLL